MIQLKNICLVVLIMISFIRCTEIYNPKIDPTSDALIVEGLITDGAGPFSIKLTKAVLFSSDSASIINYVSGAKLTVNDNENNSFELTDTGLGTYTMPTAFRAKIGNSYKLHIQTTDGSIYESNTQKLMPPQSYDSIHGTYTTQAFIDINNNELKNVGGADIKEDLFKNVAISDSMPRCRFNTNITIQYFYNLINPLIFDWYWVYFGWVSLPINSNENITDEKSLTTNGSIKDHSVGFMPFGTTSYGLMLNTPMNNTIIYYLRINQYTMNNDTYLFYKGANAQLAASGKIFDPVTTQLYGNMKCINNISKKILGLFEVSSVIQQAYLINLVASDKSIKIAKVPYIEIPKVPESEYKVWTGDPKLKPIDPVYNLIPLPNWWLHN